MASSERDEQYETALADIITLLGTAPPPLKKLRSLYNLNLGWEYAIFQMDLKISGLVIRLVGLHVTPSLPPRNKETMDIVEAISFREHRFDTISMEIFVSLATDVDLHKAYCKMLVYARRLDRVFVVLKHELCTLNAMANPGTEGEFMGFMAPNVDRAADKFWKDHPLSAAIIWTRARLEHSSSVTPERKLRTTVPPERTPRQANPSLECNTNEYKQISFPNVCSNINLIANTNMPCS